MLDELLDTAAPLVQKNNDRLKSTATTRWARWTGPDEDAADPVQPAEQRRQVHAGRRDRARRPATAPSPDGRAQFAVTDTGVGMTQAQTEKIFQPFTQADVTTTRRHGGTGLGLALVSRFCQLMGGSVAVQSAPGEGARFVVRLPIAGHDRARSTPAHRREVA